MPEPPKWTSRRRLRAALRPARRRNGNASGRGFYEYTPEESAGWEKAYEEFAFDISKLSAKYPIDLIEKRLSTTKDESMN